MSSTLFIFISIVVIVCIVLLFFVFKFMNQKDAQNLESQVSNEEIKSLGERIDNLQLPYNIESMPQHELYKATRIVLDSFKAIDYRNNKKASLQNKEWHTWQVSLLIALIKKGESIPIQKPREVFSQIILESKKSDVVSQLNRIVEKYNNNVNISKNRDELSREHIWTGEDVSLIFLYMINVEDFKNQK